MCRDRNWLDELIADGIVTVTEVQQTDGTANFDELLDAGSLGTETCEPASSRIERRDTCKIRMEGR